VNRRSRLRKLIITSAVWVILWAGVVCLVWGDASIGETFEARCVRVLDGDTIVIKHLGRQTNVRLLGIDCPEMRQPFGNDAKKLVAGMLVDRMVIIQGSRRDVYGRLLAVVISFDGFNISQLLVADGLAMWYRKYSPGDKVLELLETDAKSHKRGLWAQAAPVPPWDFRRHH
jgi:endonuclease YncB( thermonuclease family)